MDDFGDSITIECTMNYSIIKYSYIYVYIVIRLNYTNDLSDITIV